MTSFEQLFRRTIDELSRRYPDGALDWIAANQPEIHHAIKQVDDKINALWKTGDRQAFKKALSVYYKLHLEGFKRFRAAHDLPDPDAPVRELTQADIDSFKALRVEVNVKSKAGEFTLVPERTGRTDRIELIPEDIAKLAMIMETFPGSEITYVGPDEGGACLDIPAMEPSAPPQKTFTRPVKTKAKPRPEKPKGDVTRQRSFL
ncbi:MAG TPA: hypothetical protein PKW95_13335 [bacterium]|nr:hypothetical protein [bacterium]